MVSSKVIQRCTNVVAPALAPGEQIQMIEVLQLGKVSAKRQVATAAVAGIASGGLLIVAARPRPYLMVMTDQRIALVDFVNTNVGKKIALSVPRANFKAGPLKGHLLTYSMQVDTIDPAMSYRFSWGRAQAKIAKRVAAALGSPIAAADQTV
ncbi:hypothetical protein KGA66_03425 [Actinocrinis puniceicyclus]|uniref:PH domain-containing protein n=1 Tax=Actinocrinis puniceicyclus TaxID=977794 RepID=A0A8J7WLR6_9ACTN|nr:hypothetical protein [Actinocrinis puniceicyclus]MBS2962084.1 hypothetical protein [Actinocrinis puniceicyclus]